MYMKKHIFSDDLLLSIRQKAAMVYMSGLFSGEHVYGFVHICLS